MIKIHFIKIQTIGIRQDTNKLLAQKICLPQVLTGPAPWAALPSVMEH